MELSEVVKIVEERRAALGLSMADVHKVAFPGSQSSAIQNMKRGIPPTFNNLNKLCEALGLEVYIGPPLSVDEKADAIERDGQLSDISRLVTAVRVVETALSDANRKVKPARKAEIIVAAFELLGEMEEGAEQKIIRLVRAA